MSYSCPLDGTPLLFDYDEENFSYTCPSCDALYLIPQGSKVDELKEMESQAIFKLRKYETRLEEIKKEEEKIKGVFEFAKKVDY